jgi:hypothetical protein
VVKDLAEGLEILYEIGEQHHEQDWGGTRNKNYQN